MSDVLPKAMQIPRKPRKTNALAAWFYITPEGITVYTRTSDGVTYVTLTTAQVERAADVLRDYLP